MPPIFRHRLFGLRERVDELAFRAPARLAVTVFAGVIGLFAILLLVPLKEGHKVDGCRQITWKIPEDV